MNFGLYKSHVVGAKQSYIKEYKEWYKCLLTAAGMVGAQTDVQ